MILPPAREVDAGGWSDFVVECILFALDDRSHIQADPRPVVSQGAGHVCMGEGDPSGWMGKRSDLGDTRHEGVPQTQHSWPEAMGRGALDTWFRSSSMCKGHGLVLIGCGRARSCHAVTATSDSDGHRPPLSDKGKPRYCQALPDSWGRPSCLSRLALGTLRGGFPVPRGSRGPLTTWSRVG